MDMKEAVIAYDNVDICYDAGQSCGRRRFHCSRERFWG